MSKDREDGSPKLSPGTSVIYKSQNYQVEHEDDYRSVKISKWVNASELKPGDFAQKHLEDHDFD